MMKRAWIRWTIRIGSGILIALAILIGVAFIVFGRDAPLFLALLLPSFSNTNPPPMFADQVAGRPADWGFGKDLTVFLQKKFPVGTTEAELKKTLLAQGFRPPAPSAVACWPREKPAPVGQVVFLCPLHEPSKTFVYHWSRSFECGNTIFVWWTTGDQGDLTDIGGNAYRACF